MARQLRDYKHVGTLLSEWLFGNLPYVFFLFFVLLIYIANSNYAQKQIRRVQTLQNELKDMKWRYNEAKADLMLNSKQSEVEQEVQALGLKASNQRTKRIIIDK